MTDPQTDRRRVFIVEGRDEAVSTAARAFLRALDLRPVEWVEAIRATGQTQPHLLDVVLAGMRISDAVLILYTGDEMVRLRPDLVREDDESAEYEQRAQARGNVIFEAGIAQAIHPDRTVVVEFGHVKLFSDIAGKHNVRFDGSMSSRRRWADRLEAAGLAMNDSGSDWYTAGEFPEPKPVTQEDPESQPVEDAEAAAEARMLELSPQRYSPPPWLLTGVGAELVLRVATLLPGDRQLLRLQAKPATRLRADRREDFLMRLFEDAPLTAWLRSLQSTWNWTGTPEWEPLGSHSPDYTQLAWLPWWPDNRRSPIAAHATVETGWVSEKGMPGVRVVCDLTFNVLELDPQRQPSQVRWGTMPGPAPGALSPAEVVNSLAALLSTPPLTMAAAGELLDGLDDSAVETVGALFWAVGQRLGAIIDLEALRRRPNSSDSGYQVRIATASELITETGRRRVAVELIREVLERGGYRRLDAVLDALAPTDS